MKYFLNTYTPLIASAAGQTAVLKHSLSPYIDGSCRREPDLESAHPSITAVCRGRLFVTRVNKGDKIVYMTKKGTYPPHNFAHWRLVAILRVRDVHATHFDAAMWYQTKGLPLPSNCLVKGNPPVALDKTVATSIPGISDDDVLNDWDQGYQNRVSATGRFIICDIVFLNLHNPPVVKQSDLLRIFGKIPNTRIPPTIKYQEFLTLRRLAFSNRMKLPRTQGQAISGYSGMVTTPKCLPQSKNIVDLSKGRMCCGFPKGKRT